MKTIAIIGPGAEGMWWKRFFESLRRFTMLVSGSFETNQSVVDQADIIVICTPMSITPEVISSLQFRPEQFVVCAVGEMIRSGKVLAKLPCKWKQVHRMAGPAGASMRDQNMIESEEGSENGQVAELEEILAETEATVTKAGSVKHDKSVSVTQVQLRLKALMSLCAMQSLGIPPGDLAAFSSPPFRIASAVDGRLLKQGARLCFDMLSSNTFAPQVIGAMHEALDRIRECIESGDFDAFEILFTDVCKFVGNDFIAGGDRQVNAMIAGGLDHVPKVVVSNAVTDFEI